MLFVNLTVSFTDVKTFCIVGNSFLFGTANIQALSKLKRLKTYIFDETH